MEMSINILMVCGIYCMIFQEIKGDVPDGCDPTAECLQGTVQGMKVPDPDNCENYYQCLGSPPAMYPSDAPESCIKGDKFDYDVGECDSDGGVQCTSILCDPPNIFCHKDCSGAGTILGDPNDCNTYYVCTLEGAIEKKCTDDPNNGMYFNGTVCQDIMNRCCDMCEAYCVELNVQIPDPYDCTRFYVCSVLGIITDNTDYRSVCPESQHFDIDTSKCIQGETCSNYCI